MTRTMKTSQDHKIHCYKLRTPPEEGGAKAAKLDTTQAHGLTGTQWRRCKIESNKEWKVMTINIGGGRRALEWALEQNMHISMIQEYRGTRESSSIPGASRQI